MILENWFPHPTGSIFGIVYGDTKKRFPDGANIHTSTVLYIDLAKRKVYTMNSEYDLGEPLFNEDETEELLVKCMEAANGDS